jgi:2-C-methyl-D-erythritol 4-phosphate cytidylyltransferase
MIEEAIKDVSVIIPAAGNGDRMGGAVRKPLLQLGGEPILFRACRRLKSVPGVLEIIVAVHPDDVAYFQDEAFEQSRAAGIDLVVAGGSCRAQSVWNALEVVSAKAELVAVHDAVRPFVPADTVKALFSTARKRGAAVPVIPLSDTVKRIDGDAVVETPRRSGLMQVQTPQVFKSDLLIEAYEYRMATGTLSEYITDDAQLVEALDQPVAAVLGHPHNMKITTPADLRLAELLLSAGLAE